MERICTDVMNNILNILGEHDDLTNVRQVSKFMYSCVKPKHIIEKVSVLRFQSPNIEETKKAFEKAKIIAQNRGLFQSILGFKRKNAAQGEKYIVDNFTHIAMFQRKIIGLIKYDESHVLDFFREYFIMKKFQNDEILSKLLKILDIYVFNFLHIERQIIFYVKFENDKWYANNEHNVMIRKDKAIAIIDNLSPS